MRGTESESGQSKFCFHEDLSIFKMAAKMATPKWPPKSERKKKKEKKKKSKKKKKKKSSIIFAYKWQRIILSSTTEDLPECSDEKLTWLCNIER